MNNPYSILNPEPWASDPNVNCAPRPGMTPKQAGEWADQWFPAPAREGMATFLCARCPQKTPCGEFGMTARDANNLPLTGVFGGLTTDQRAQLRKNQAEDAA